VPSGAVTLHNRGMMMLLAGGRSWAGNCRVVLITLLVVACSAGCNSSPASPSGSAPFSQVDLRLGAGEEAAVGRVVTVHYTGWLYNEAAPDNKGLQFDSSAGTPGFTFTVGIGEVIAGWDQGIPGMRTGGARRLVVPPSLAYGASRNERIPPAATLVFDIELVSIDQ
jgi:FKBP-type peptidyl-prolyl cis-trans isomerase FkpA